jgi:hypothetical protein
MKNSALFLMASPDSKDTFAMMVSSGEAKTYISHRIYQLCHDGSGKRVVA